MKYSYIDIVNCIDKKDLDCLKKIFKNQPNLLTIDYNGDRDSPLHYASEFGDEFICKYLIEQGIDVNYVQNKTETPLSYAASSNNIVNAKILLNNNAIVDGLETSIVSPLLSAVTFGHLDMIKLLVKNGANVNRMHIRNGMLPLDIAISRKYIKIADFLRKNGAKTQYDLPSWVEKEIDGSGILSLVTLELDKILPVKITNTEDISPVDIKMTRANSKKNRVLFTFGLFKIHKPMLEIFIVLPEYYNFYDNKDLNQFPIQLLKKLIEVIIEGLKITEGYQILASDDKFKKLTWPENLAGLFLSDVKWNKANSSNKEKDSKVTLYTLIPIKKTKTGFSKQSIEKNRNATWNKMCLNLGIY